MSDLFDMVKAIITTPRNNAYHSPVPSVLGRHRGQWSPTRDGHSDYMPTRATELESVRLVTARATREMFRREGRQGWSA